MQNVDVVIVGGGIAGLCVLRKLRIAAPDLSVVLVGGGHGIGGGQTCHGHAMLHRGHYQIGRFPLPTSWVNELDGAMVQRIRRVLDEWRDNPAAHGRAEPRDQADMEALLWLGAASWAEAGAPVAGPRPHGENRAIYLDANVGKSHLRDRWTPATTERLAELGAPPVGFDAWEVHEEWVDPNQVTAWLVDGSPVSLRAFIVSGNATLKRDHDAVVVAAGSKRFRTHQVVVAAGEVSPVLLNEYEPPVQGTNRLWQAVETKLYELVMRGPEASGPSLLGARAGGIRWQEPRTGGFRKVNHHGLLSSHPAGADALTWVFTDGLDVLSAGPLKDWVQYVVGFMETNLGIRRADLHWCAKARTTLEWRFEPQIAQIGHWSIQRCNKDYLSGRPEARMDPNVLFVWPTKLTLSLLLADDVFRHLDLTPQYSQPDLRDEGGELPALQFARAPWDDGEDLLSWDDFIQRLSAETP